MSHNDTEDSVVQADRGHWTALGEELRYRLGRGAALEPHVRTHFEGRLGGSLAGTMIHRSPLGGHLARVLGAQAVSAGQHVVGSADDLDPSTPAGAALLGHELTHTLQRDTSAAGEDAAQAVERAVAAAANTPGSSPDAAGGIDIDQLAERVYERMVEELLRDRDRAAWVG